MKTIIISCNYFAKSENRLKNCLESLKKNKLPNTIILMGDNNSTDGSIELIQEYVDNGTVDGFYKSPKNIGKSKILNTLYYIAKKNFNIEPNDILMNIDSDIELKNSGDYLSIVEDYYSHILTDNRTVCGIYPYKSTESVTDINFYYPFDERKIPFKKEYGYTVKTPNDYHIAGGCFSTLCKYHEAIGGYIFKQGVNGIPTYGGDDAFYMLYLNNIIRGEFKLCADLKMFHMDDQNKEYKKWKLNAIHNILNRIPSKNYGFFDKENN